MPDPTKEFSAADMLAELEADEQAAPAEEVAEDAPAEEVAEVEPAAEVEETAPEEEEDDEKWATGQAAGDGGKSIPMTAFQARLQRWKKTRTDLEGRHKATQTELEAARKAQPASAEDLERFKRLDGVFQNLDKSARELPWMTPILLALGQGKKPDWAQAQKDMAAYLESVPKGDPILYQQQQELRQQVEELQTERLNNAAVSHIQSEDVEIAKILGDKSDPVAAQFWAMLNEQAKHAFEAMNPKSFKEGPNRVQMAQRLKAAVTAYHQKQLKAAIPAVNRPKASLATGNGAAAGAPNEKDKAPADINSPEWAAWFAKGLQT